MKLEFRSILLISFGVTLSWLSTSLGAQQNGAGDSTGNPAVETPAVEQPAPAPATEATDPVETTPPVTNQPVAEPAPAPVQVEPAVTPARTATRETQRPARNPVQTQPPAADQGRIIPISQESISSEVPDFHQDLIPGYQRQPVEKLHGDDDAEQRENAQEPEPVEQNDEDLESDEPGPSILDRFSSWLGEFELNSSIVNTLLLVVIVIVFVLYRMRGGRSRRNF